MNISELGPETCQRMVSKLTRQQRESLVQYIHCGSAKGAALQMGLSDRTVETHLERCRFRLGVKLVTHAVVIGTKAGLV